MPELRMALRSREVRPPLRWLDARSDRPRSGSGRRSQASSIDEEQMSLAVEGNRSPHWATPVSVRRELEVEFGPPCSHQAGRVIGVYAGHGRDRRRQANTQDFSTEARRAAMGIN